MARQLLLAAPIRLWALILAGPPLTGFAAWLAWMVRHGWGEVTESQRLAILGDALMLAMVLIGVIVVALAAIKVRAETKLGSISVDGDEHSPASP
jgi:hypothetical protein